MHHRRRYGDKEYLEQRSADHHAGTPAENVEHRRNAQEPASDSPQQREDSDHHAHQQRRQRSDIESCTIEPPAHRQTGEERMLPSLRGPRSVSAAVLSKSLQAFARHQSTDRSQQEDVKDVDDRIDLTE